MSCRRTFGPSNTNGPLSDDFAQHAYVSASDANDRSVIQTGGPGTCTAEAPEPPVETRSTREFGDQG